MNTRLSGLHAKGCVVSTNGEESLEPVGIVSSMFVCYRISQREGLLAALLNRNAASQNWAPRVEESHEQSFGRYIYIYIYILIVFFKHLYAYINLLKIILCL